MKLIGDIFESKRTKKMFDAENYTSQEFRSFMKCGKIDSRLYERVSYFLTNGQIVVINKR